MGLSAPLQRPGLDNYSAAWVVLVSATKVGTSIATGRNIGDASERQIVIR